MVQEILTDRCEVLSAKASFLLKFIRAVSKATALIFLPIFAVLAPEPVAAEFCPDLPLPPVFCFDDYVDVCSLHIGLWRRNNSLRGLLARNVADG